jgi:hypothetical protein
MTTIFFWCKQGALIKEGFLAKADGQPYLAQKVRLT